jgi:site-specific recombinase XerD
MGTQSAVPNALTLQTIPSVQVITRHAPECPYRGDESWRKCNCRKALRWTHGGKQYRQSAKTRSWAKAEEARRSVEDKFKADSAAPVRIETESRKTLDQAIELFLVHKKNEGIGTDVYGKYQRELERLRTFMEKHGRYFPSEMRSEDLIHFQATWTKQYPSSHTRSRVLTRLRAFLRFCYEAGWMERIPKMSKVRVEEAPTLPLSDAEYTRLLSFIPKTFTDDRKVRRVRALVQFMRYSGLAIRDAVTLERSKIVLDSERKLYRVVTKRTKTGTDVSVILPPAVSAEVLAAPNDNPKYLFWNTGTGTEHTAVVNWQHDLRTLFRKAGFPEGHPHQLRDTFAVSLLEKGVPIEEVSRLLGHESIRTTERHYAAWVKSRQDRLDSLMLATF